MKWYRFDIRKLTDDEYNKWYSLMGDEKKKRVERFKNPDDKRRTVVGEMLARQAICEWCNVQSEDIVFLTKEFGKPYAENLMVEFNVSHSENMVVCAVNDSPIGIDVEKIRKIDLAIAKRICNDTELEYIFGRTPRAEDFKIVDEPAILKRFFEIWTAKEAFGKYSGRGLANIGLAAKENVKKEIIDDEYFVSIYF